LALERRRLVVELLHQGVRPQGQAGRPQLRGGTPLVDLVLVFVWVSVFERRTVFAPENSVPCTWSERTRRGLWRGYIRVAGGRGGRRVVSEQSGGMIRRWCGVGAVSVQQDKHSRF
jgi:hypothetical protein